MTRTRVGAERLLDAGAYRESRVGLVTNPTGILPDGRPTWRALLEAGYRLETLFGPEHGFRGDAQDAVEVRDEEFRGIRVHSLYGARERPDPRTVVDLDCVLYDVQDVGCRYYTYLYTLAYVMDVCEQTGTRVVVLDRPDPIRADITEGNPIASEYDNFLSGYGLAPRYGMTVGEFAHYLRDNYYPNADLDVWWMSGYERSFSFPDTGLPWPLPSPNLPSVDTAFLYPGTCLLEGTNLSEGRGTTRPFELFGAPWLNAEALRDRLASCALPGVAFSELFFTPTFSKYRGELCNGILVHVTDRDALVPVRLGITLLSELAAVHSDEFAFKPLWEDESQFFLDRLAGGPLVREMISSGENADATYEAFAGNHQEFLARRSPALYY